MSAGTRALIQPDSLVDEASSVRTEYRLRTPSEQWLRMSLEIRSLTSDCGVGTLPDPVSMLSLAAFSAAKSIAFSGPSPEGAIASLAARTRESATAAERTAKVAWSAIGRRTSAEAVDERLNSFNRHTAWKSWCCCALELW